MIQLCTHAVVFKMKKVRMNRNVDGTETEKRNPSMIIRVIRQG